MDDRRFVSGILICFNFGPIVYRAKAQPSVVLSSVEAEYMALSAAAQEVVWVRLLLHDMGANIAAPTTILEGNQGAITLSKNTGYSARTKHIDIRHHFVRERIAAGQVTVQYVQTESQMADILTKTLSTKRFIFLRDTLVKSSTSS